MASRVTLAVLIAVALCSPAALAHRLKVFALADGAEISGSVYFVGGAPAPGVELRVGNARGEELLRVSPDADGRFRFPAIPGIDHVIVADSGDGHVARWTVRAAELPAVVAGVTAVPAPAAVADPVIARDVKLDALVEQAVARQVAPLREQLAGYEEKVRLHDVLGGIGYIVGLAGLALWWRARRGGGRG